MMTPQEKEILEAKLQRVYATEEATQTLLKMMHNDIIKVKETTEKTMIQAYKTNGTVKRLDVEVKQLKLDIGKNKRKIDALEDLTGLLKWIKDHPKKAFSILAFCIVSLVVMGAEFGPVVVKYFVTKWIG